MAKKLGSGHNTPIPTKVDKPKAAKIAYFMVYFFISTGTSSFFSAFLAGFFAASNSGRGSLHGHKVEPSLQMIDLFTTSSSILIWNFFSLSTIEANNLVILLEYNIDDYPANLDGKSVYPIILTPLCSTI